MKNRGARTLALLAAGLAFAGAGFAGPRQRAAPAEAAAPAAPIVVGPGMDLWETPAGGTTWQDFSAMPIPPGFFGPCAPPLQMSDPFTGTITFKGAPLASFPPGPLGPTDTIVVRPAPASLPAPGDSATVPIQIVALSLVSVAPIAVTYNGGVSSEPWDVRACLSQAPQPQGTMTITRDPLCENGGGTFTSTLPVRARLVFKRLLDQCTVTLDTARMGLPPLMFATPSGTWLPSAPPSLGLISVPFPGLQVDGDCNGAPDPQPLPATTANFHPGLRLLRCAGDPPCAGDQVKRLTGELAELAAHGILPAEQPHGDVDEDGVPDPGDNCAPPYHPPTFNPLQEDLDGDGHGDACDNCPTACNATQSDPDLDGLGSACDCAPTDPANPPPGEVQGLVADADGFSWSPEPSAVVYDMLRGALSGLPVGPGGEDEVCFPGIEGTSASDPSTPTPGEGYWYGTRGVSPCGSGLWGNATAGPRVSDTCDAVSHHVDIVGLKVPYLSDLGPQQALTNGGLVLDGAGRVKELALRAASMPTLAGPSGLVTIGLDPDVAQVGGFVGGALSLQFGVRVNTDITDANLGFTQDPTLCMGGAQAGTPCVVDADCFDGSCEVSGYCVCDTDTSHSSFAQCAGSLSGGLDLDGNLHGTFSFDCEGDAVVNSGIEAGTTTISAGTTTAARACPKEKNCQLKKVCIQPVVIAQDDGSAPSSCPSFEDTKDLWKDCCIEVEVKAAKTIKKSAYRTLDESKNDTPTAEQKEMFEAESDDAGAGGCIEVYCAKTFEQDGKTSKDISGGGACYHSNSAKCKVVVVEGATSTLPAHEVGHCFGLKHSDDGDTVMKPTGKHDAAAPKKTKLDPCKKAHGGNVGKLDEEKCCKNPDL